MISWALGFAGSGWCKARTSTFSRMSYERKIPGESGPFAAGMVLGKPKWIMQCDQSLSPQPLRSLGLIGMDFVHQRIIKRVSRPCLCVERAYFSGSGLTRETKMNFERQSETCSMVLVVLRCVQACFRVLFTCSWIRRPESPVRKASTNVRECPDLSRRLLKCAQRCH
ncbi:hypothetical protein CDL15_Pgr011641 [Punica granatum]|uniref:Uncharacterized protein n=1 Tax=Punica granatum TaxID=22663 RepID=A0A218XHQ0_PUNGR|nr:hypothetical protein CDL15_Pgr011641 [Punica granatum]PKI50221.1 hypothetical protein CRG98_029404 [Punica granatum]